MIGQSFAITAVILVMAFMFLRAKKKGAAVLTLPLICVPVSYLVYRAFFSGSGDSVAIAFVIGGFLLDALLCALLAHAIPSVKGRWVYLTISILFPLLLSIAYIMQIS